MFSTNVHKLFSISLAENRYGTESFVHGHTFLRFATYRQKLRKQLWTIVHSGEQNKQANL